MIRLLVVDLPRQSFVFTYGGHNIRLTLNYNHVVRNWFCAASIDGVVFNSGIRVVPGANLLHGFRDVVVLVEASSNVIEYESLVNGDTRLYGVTRDEIVDITTGNVTYCGIKPVYPESALSPVILDASTHQGTIGNVTLTDGNLTVRNDSSTYVTGSIAESQAIDSGARYWETLFLDDGAGGSSDGAIGLIGVGSAPAWLGENTTSVGLYVNGDYWWSTNNQGSIGVFAQGTVIGHYYNTNPKSYQVTKDGINYNEILTAARLANFSWVPAWSLQNSAAFTFVFDENDFIYAPPAGATVYPPVETPPDQQAIDDYNAALQAYNDCIDAGGLPGVSPV